MNLKTTLALIVLAAAGGGWYLYRNVAARRPDAADQSQTLRTAHSDFQPERLARIEIARANDRIVFVHGTGWSLDGSWPARTPEVQQVVDAITGLSSRFEPITNPDKLNFSEYGLARDQQPVQVVVTVRAPDNKEQSHTLLFGEPPNDSTGNPFTKPTYLRMDEQTEVIRLAPGVKAILNRPRETYLKRQLFPEIERVKLDAPRPSFPGEPESTVPVMLLLEAKEIAVTGPEGSWTLRRIGPRLPSSRSGGTTDMTLEKLAARWELTVPVTDRVDPDRLRPVLASVPELWVERFVDDPGQAKTGLDKPERTVAVQFDARPAVKLLIGSVSRIEERKAAAPAPPNPFTPPPPAPPAVREEYRYAKLPDNPQVFEVKSDKFPDLFFAAVTLRDPKLLRFKPADVRRVEIARGEEKTVLAKEGDRWDLVEPVKVVADAPKVTELIDRIAELQASGPDLLDATDLKPLGLDAANGPQITLSFAEKDKPNAPQTLTLKLGKRDEEKKKLAVQASGNARVAMISDEFWKLYDRSALAYRGKRLLDSVPAKIATIAIQRGQEAFTLAQKDGGWSLTSPISANADPSKTGVMANDLARLDAVEFIADAAKPEELPKYGLDKPTASAMLNFNDGSPAKTLQLGVGREGKPEVYAKLADAPQVFTVRSAIRDEVDQPSLAFRPLQVWQFPAAEVSSIDVTRGAETYKLMKAVPSWRLIGPFDGNASSQAVQPLLGAAGTLRAERYETHKADDLAKYGLLRPQLQIGVSTPAGAKTALIGNSTGPNAKSRFAKLADADAVFVVPESVVAAIDRPAIDLLDRQLLSLNVNQIAELKGVGSDGNWSLRRNDGTWTIQSLKPPAPADRAAADDCARIWANVQATRFVEIGSRTDFARYGLDRPRASATAVLSSQAAAGETHTIAVGDKSRDADAYFVRVDQTQGVAEVPSAVARQLIHGELDFVNRDLLSFDVGQLVAIKRHGGVELELTKGADGWTSVKPAGQKLDQVGMEELAERLAHLRVTRVIAIDADDPSRYGLDKPLVTVTLALRGSDGQVSEKSIELGRTVAARYDEPDGSRYVRLAGSRVVGILPPVVADRLVGESLRFRDRQIARFPDADRIILERGPRRIAFAKADGPWKVTEPLATEAETAELDDLVNSIARLRADELVAERPADLRKYGLDAPEARWRFFSGEREVLNLLIGKADGSSGRRFAKLADGDIVFLLDASLSNHLLAEHRKRSLWSGIDAAQVETLVYGVGDKMLVLQKIANAWQVPGKPEQSVNMTTVTDLLSAFANLKVERYIADKDADLKRFGLQPPARTIVVRPGTGNPQTLYLGAFEPGSKRIYARIYDPSRSDVFVLTESDSGKLFKDLADFTAK
jgi:hypothetical protein